MRNKRVSQVNEKLLDRVLDKIKLVGNKFERIKGLIITESDMKCQIYSELQKLVKEDSATADKGILGSPLHTEVAYYNPNEQNYADNFIDIALFNAKQFSINKEVEIKLENNQIITQQRPNKQYRTLGAAILIELKFCKKPYGIGSTVIDEVKYDFNKLKALIDFNSDIAQMFGVIVVFNKTNKYLQEFETEILNFTRV